MKFNFFSKKKKIPKKEKKKNEKVKLVVFRNPSKHEKTDPWLRFTGAKKDDESD